MIENLKGFSIQHIRFSKLASTISSLVPLSLEMVATGN